MNAQETVTCFFCNLVRLIDDARMTPERLSRAIGREPEYVADLMARQAAPGLEAMGAMAEVLEIDVATFLRRKPLRNNADAAASGDWAQRLAEQILADAVAESREESCAAPTIDTVLHWWHEHGGLLADMEALTRHVEIFDPPDLETMRPVPRHMGPRSLGCRELGISGLDELNQIFRNAEPGATCKIATGHAKVIGGKPDLSYHSMMVELRDGRLVKMSYARLLLPVHDGDGKQFVLNHATPMRRDEIGAEDAHSHQSPHRQPAILSLN